jgi:predicted dehydrogenase
MKTQPERIRALFLGCGAASAMHSRMLRRMRGVELAYASRDRGRAEQQRQRFGGWRSFGSYEDGLAETSIDVVLVTTPTALHRALTSQALQAGKHVIVEKPAFMRAADADGIKQLASSVRRGVFVAENYVYKPITALLRRVIGEGGLGDVRLVSVNATKRQAVRGWRGDPALSGGGALFESGVHWISFMSHFGLDVEGIEGFRAGGGEGPDLSSVVVFRYAGGIVGTLAQSWELPAPLRGVRASKVQGTRGAVTFESNGFAALITGGRKAIWLPFHDPLGYRAMHADFASSIRNSVPPQFTLDMAQRDLGWLEMAHGSTPTTPSSTALSVRTTNSANAGVVGRQHPVTTRGTPPWHRWAPDT